mmetsp:Transcript_11385/g.34504  ORF Transcript_11385/g.34504 Transcript_11385/m.34504 type:complete len:220 (-) Transcript_11385:4128-4787(-)
MRRPTTRSSTASSTRRRWWRPSPAPGTRRRRCASCGRRWRAAPPYARTAARSCSTPAWRGRTSGTPAASSASCTAPACGRRRCTTRTSHPPSRARAMPTVPTKCSSLCVTLVTALMAISSANWESASPRTGAPSLPRGCAVIFPWTERLSSRAGRSSPKPPASGLCLRRPQQQLRASRCWWRSSRALWKRRCTAGCLQMLGRASSGPSWMTPRSCSWPA